MSRQEIEMIEEKLHRESVEALADPAYIKSRIILSALVEGPIIAGAVLLMIFEYIDIGFMITIILIAAVAHAFMVVTTVLKHANAKKELAKLNGETDPQA